MIRRSALVAACGVAAICSNAAFGQGIAGTVTDAESGAPIADATIFLTGTSRTASSGEDGRYRFEGAALGVVRLRAIRVGFASATTSLTVSESGLGIADFALSRSVLQLDELVTTASGDARRRRENGSSVARLTVDSVELAPIQTFADLLTGRVAGLTVQHSSGTTGTGSSVRIRGSNSASLSNEPLYIIDGLWFDNSPASYSINIGGQSPSRLDEIDPEDIEALEVIRGPSAAALYGTAAANGVIQVRTRQGIPGPTHWHFHVEGGTIDNVSQFPANFGIWTHSPGFPPLANLTSNPGCNLVLVADGACVADSVAWFNPIEQHSPFRTGARGAVGVSASGGAPAATYYLSAALEHESGVYEVNVLDRVSVRANLRAQLTKNLQAAVTTSFTHRRLGLLHNDADFAGFGGPLLNGVDGLPFENSFDGYGHPTFGYDPIGPDQIFRVVDRQTTDHQTAGLTLTWQPRPWLAFTGITGLDRVSSFDEETIPSNSIFIPDFVSGSRTANQGLVTNYTVNFSGTATFEIAHELLSRAGLGVLYHRDRAHLQGGFGRGLTGGSGSLAGTVGDFAVSEIEDQNRTFGIVGSEQLAWHDRLFVTGALRRDLASAFARTSGSVIYPAVSLSWVVGEEPFFPYPAPISSLRLRAAYGQSGLAPRARDAETFFLPVPVRLGAQDVPGITVGNLSDPTLRPERSSELELGFDAGFFRERLGLEATYYRKRSRDALVSVPVPGSVGSASSRLENLGTVANEGVEITLTSDLLRGSAVSWSVALTAWGNRNRLLMLGGGVDQVVLSATQRHVPGFPLGGYWAVPLDSVRDVNGDGLISSAEVFFDPSKDARFVGSAAPTRGGSLRSGLRLGGRLKVSGLLDYRGGNHTLNITERTRCVTGVCAGLALFAAPLDRKASAAASLLFGTAYQDAYIEDAGFLKLRELALDLAVPDRWAHRLGATAVAVTLAGRNLATWSRYSGPDPEADSRGQSNFLRADGFSQPQVRYFVLRVSASY